MEIRGVKQMCEVICPYKGKCTGEGCKCKTCSRNSGKKDYYKPDDDWYTPCYPYQPWYPYYPYDRITWYTTGNDWNTSVTYSFSIDNVS